MRKFLSLLTTAVMTAGLSLVTATPAQAADYCFGLPSEPLAYVCVGLGDVTTPDPQVSWVNIPVTTVPSACYGVGCTEPTTVYASYPVVSGISTPSSVTIYWNGYTLPGSLDGIIDEAVATAVDLVNRILSEPIVIDPVCTKLAGCIPPDSPLCLTKPAICLPPGTLVCITDPDICL